MRANLSCAVEARSGNLEDRAARTLELLCRRRGEVVSKAELIDAVWGGRSISANSVAVVIGDLRKAIEEDAHAPVHTQRFRNIHIEQDGALANVSLVFVNTTARGAAWGWKTLQLLKVEGQWKIASEFYTAHS
jgi:hypothetical protein